MAKPPVNTGQLITGARSTLEIARDHSDALADFGTTTDALDSFESKIQAFESQPSHAINQLDLSGLTEQKSNKLLNCYHWCRELRGRLRLSTGKDSLPLRSLPAKELQKAKISERRMIPVMEKAIKLANDHHAELALVGQTDEIRDRGAALLNSLKQADNVQELKKGDNLSATQDRHQQMKEIYDITNRINFTGRLAFHNDPVRKALFRSKWR